MNFTEKLDYWIRNTFRTKRHFLEQINVSQSSLFRYLNGKQEPTMEFFVTLRKLGCDINWLITDSDSEASTYGNYKNLPHTAVLEDGIQYIKSERSKDELRNEIARLNSEVVEKNNQLYQIIENSDSHFIQENKLLRDEIEQLKIKLKSINELSQL